jgi:hypothetical protein
LILAGALSIVIGVALVSVEAAFIVAGVVLLLAGVDLTRPNRRPTGEPT